MSGFKDTTQAKSVTVWINDQYQGVYWLQNNYDKRYFSEKYGEYKGQFTVTEGTLSGMDTEKIVEDPNEIRAIEEFNSLCNDLYLMDMDAANQEDWEYISSVIDVDNFIKYVAIEIYINNTDWGTNNVKVYRYFPEDGEELTDGTVFDGRYRYLLYDMDYGLGLFAFGVYGLDASYDRLEELLNENNECSKLFRVIMKREECRQKLASEIVGLINGAFSVENAVPVLKQLIQSQQDELHHMVENTAILARSLYPTDVTNSDNIDKEYEKIETFLADRPEYMYESLGKAFGYNDRYLINLTGVEGLAIDMNDRPMDKTADVLDIPIRLSSNTAGIQIHGWYINNQYFPGNVVEFMPSQYCDETKNIIAKPDWEIVSGSLRIQNAQISGTEDYVVLKNEGLSDVYLQDYAISDTFLNLFKFTLPDVLLKPGEQFIIYGSKYCGEQDKDSLQVSFSWNKLEAVYLSHVIEGLIDTW